MNVCVEAGHPVLSHGIMVDITEQKRQNEKLTQLQCAVDYGMEGVALLSADGMYTYMLPGTPQYHQLFGRNHRRDHA